MSGSRRVATSSWLSGSLRPFLYGSSVYSYYFFLISFASVRFLSFMSCIMPIIEWNVPLISPIFLKRSLVFPILLLSSISSHCSLKKAPLISPCYSLKVCIQLAISFPFLLVFHSEYYRMQKQSEITITSLLRDNFL